MADRLRQLRRYVAFALIFGFILGCASKILQSKDASKLDFSKDFDKVVKIEPVVPATPAPEQAPAREKHAKKKRVKKKHKKEEEALVRQPPFEDFEGMDGRRPKQDPFRIGEKMTLDVSYFNVQAGSMTMEVLPFAEVNGRKAYRLQYTATSSKVFSVFYAVEDVAETFLDYENMIPSTYQLHVKESKQLREVRAFWDFKTNQANVWDKKVTKEKGVEEKETHWDLQPYAQNVFSAAYYMRTFQMYPGKKLSFYVADDGQNYLFKGEILRKEKIKCPAGEFDAVVLRPQFELNGMFHPVGDVLFWLSDDDRKFIVRIESKIKIGKIIAQLRELNRGQ